MALKNLKEALQLALQQQEEIERKDQEITELKPDADYAREHLRSTSTFNVTEIGQAVGMTAIELNRKVKDLGFSIRQGICGS